MVAGNFDEAEADLLHSIFLYPNAEIALANLASLYANTSRLPEAKLLVERLIRIDPRNLAYVQMYRAVSQ